MFVNMNAHLKRKDRRHYLFKLQLAAIEAEKILSGWADGGYEMFIWQKSSKKNKTQEIQRGPWFALETTSSTCTVAPN